MKDEATREMLKCEAKPGQKLIELQRAEWDPMNIDRDLGCQFLDKLEEHVPGKDDLIALRSEFIITAQRSFLQAMEDKRPTKLERKKPMPRETIIEFFDACNTKMDLPETREKLVQTLESTQQVPNQVIIDLQRELLEVFGFEREHGCAMLSNIGSDFPQDQELHQRFAMWRNKAHMTCMQAVKQHQVNGGQMPKHPELFSGTNPELIQKAKEELSSMTPEQRKELFDRFQKKVEVYMNLPPEGKAAHMKKLGDAEKLEYAKAQILMVNMMQLQWQQQQEAAKKAQASGSAGSVPLTKPVDTPQQQQMM